MRVSASPREVRSEEEEPEVSAGSVDDDGGSQATSTADRSSSDSVSVPAPVAASVSDAKAESTRLLRRKYRRKSAAVMLVVSVALCAFVVVVACIYLAGLWDPIQYLGRLDVAVLNADRAVRPPGSNASLSLGAAVVAALNATRILHWRFLDAARVSREDVIEAVWRDRYWSALYIPADFTEVFAASLHGLGVNASSAYTNSLEYIQDTSKQYPTSAAAQSVVTAIVEKISDGVLARMHAGAFGPASQRSPLALWATPVGLRMHHIHPAMQSGWFLATFTSVMFCYVPSLVVINVVFRVFHLRMSDRVRVRRWSVVLARLALVSCVAAVDAAVIAGTARSFGLPMVKGLSSVWSVLFLCKMAFSFGIIAPLLAWLGPAGGVLCSILMIVQTVTSTGMYDRRLMAAGFRVIAPMFPMYHGVMLLRNSAFDALPDGVALHRGVLLAWLFAGGVLAVVAMALGAGDRNMRSLKPSSAKPEASK
eukprot:m51a1_g8438 hypothetical protein (480) ;mRNA; f:362911-364522